MSLLALASCGNGNGYTVYVPASVVVGDFNHDGVPDIAIASAAIDQTLTLQNNYGFVAVALNNKSSPGTFQNATHYSIAGAPSGLAVGDVVTAGQLDLVATSNAAGKVSVLLHSTSTAGSFEASIDAAITDALGAAQPNAVAIADVNGDGKPDLLIADGNTGASQTTGVVGTKPGNLIIMLQDAANPGHFTQSQTLPLGPPNTFNRGVRVAVGDLNGDGLVDVAVTNFDINGQNGVVSIFFQNPAAPGTFLPEVNLDAGSEPAGIVIADVNGDGVPDIVIASEGQTTDNTGVAGATILLNSKAHPGTFSAPVTYRAQYGSIGIAVGDLNGDGLPDIVLTSADYPQGTGSITVMLNQKTAPGTFLVYGAGAAASLGTGTYPGLGHTVGVAIADLNGDGVPDLAIADGTGICIMLGVKGSPGTFGAISQVGG